MGGVRNDVCMVTQNSMPVHNGSKPSPAITGVKIGTRIGTIPTHSIKRPKIKKAPIIIARIPHLPIGKPKRNPFTKSPPPTNIKVPVKTKAAATINIIILETRNV